MKFLVVGGSGFLGSHLVDSLVGVATKTLVFDRKEDPSRGRNRLAEYHINSLPTADVCIQLAIEVDVIVYLACGVRTQDGLENSIENITRDTRFLADLLIAIRKRKSRFVYISSGGAIYGECSTQQGFSEKDFCRPKSAYGLLKLTQEGYINTMLSGSSCSYVILRPTNLYGPRQNPYANQGVVSVLLNKALRNEPLTIYGDGTAMRDFLYVSDLVRAILACSYSSVSGQAFNVGCGRATAINEIIDVIREVSGLDVKCEYLPRREFDLQSAYLDVSKIEKSIGWRAAISLKQGICETLEFLRFAELK